MRVDRIIDMIEELAPLFAAAPWDKSGVQVAAFRESASKIAVMLDPRIEHIKKAVEDGADFILAHHPLSMKPRYPDRADDYLAVLSLLLGKNIWLYSAHTSLDASPFGTAGWLSKELGLSGIKVLEPYSGPVPEAMTHTAESFGFGFVGRLEKPLPYTDFCRHLGKALGKTAWSVCGSEPSTVKTVACCPGSGGQMLGDALDAGADVYITGDVKYHAALEAEDRGLRIIDVGHFILEEEMMRRFTKILEERLTIPVVFHHGKDPLNFEQINK